MSTAAHAEPVVAVRGAAKAFPGVVALDHVDFAVHPGEVVGLVGKNGAGKSTLIKVLAGVVAPDAGEIRVAGEPVTLHSPQDATRLGLAFLHQELSDVPTLSVAENVLLGLGFPRRGPFVSWRALHRRAREILDQLEVDVDTRRLVGSLSVVDQRQVMIARALAQQARVVVLDEPSASLTESEIRRVHAVIATLRARGVAVVYVSHRLDEILAITDRVVVMRNGAVVESRPTQTLDHPELVRLITGSAEARPQRTRRRAPREEGGRELLRVEGLELNGEVAAVGLTVHAGEILGLAGLVGSGRTELVRAIYGADRLATARLVVDGRPVSVRSPADAIRAGIVLLPEDRRNEGNIIDFGIRENVTLPTLRLHRRVGWLATPSVEHERRAARRRMSELAIGTGDCETLVRWLSGGNQQKVMLAKWLERAADVFIFDEPTQGIDVEAKEQVFDLLETLAADGRGIVLISSDFSELAHVCDRVLVLSDGRIGRELTRDSITESRIVAACYGGDDDS